MEMDKVYTIIIQIIQYIYIYIILKNIIIINSKIFYTYHKKKENDLLNNLANLMFYTNTN